MKTIITCRNINVSDEFKETIEKKLTKLEKYFSNDIEANVLLSAERNRQKVEATIRVRGSVFRAEQVANDLGEGIDSVVEKLSTQMSRFKTKLHRKHQDNHEFAFDQWPEYDEVEESKIVKVKDFELLPMNIEEAIMQMELVGHTFFVFMNGDTQKVNVVYKRKNNDYGLIDPKY